MANGNPQYIEICATALDDHHILQRERYKGHRGESSPGDRHNIQAAELSPEGASALMALEPPKKIAGFIRSTLGSLGPQERLLVQVLSLFPRPGAQPSGIFPQPTLTTLRRAYESIAEIEADKLAEVLGRLVLYGVVAQELPRPPRRPPGTHLSNAAYSAGTSGGGGHHFGLTWALLQDMAAGMLLTNQRDAILGALGIGT